VGAKKISLKRGKIKPWEKLCRLLTATGPLSHAVPIKIRAPSNPATPIPK
jgi:hypothetical protein